MTGKLLLAAALAAFPGSVMQAAAPAGAGVPAPAPAAVSTVAAPVLEMERRGVRHDVVLSSRDGEVRIRLGMRVRDVLEGLVKVTPQFPFTIISCEGLELRVAPGLNRAWLSDGRPAWLPDAPKMEEGILSLTPRTLRSVFALLGLRSSWAEGGLQVVIDETALPTPAHAVVPVTPRPVPPSRQAMLSHIVLDPGHGGEDVGARSRRRRMYEKDITLDLGLRVRKLLEAKGIRITMTRQDDRKVTLEERVEIAQQAGADLFVSLHINSSRNRSARGVETYVYGQSVTSRSVADLVRRENAEADYVDIIVNDLQQRLYHDSSIRVAGSVEDELVRQLNVQGRSGKLVKEAPFYVLARARRPAVLLEIGFISNSSEEERMRGSGWRQRVAESIADGLSEMGKPGRGSRRG